MKLERGAGIYAVDAYLSGPDTPVQHPACGKADRSAASLSHPAGGDGGQNWKPGKLWFMDKDGAYVLRLFNSVDSLIFINTDFVKAEEMKSAKDLLHQKWQGKISSEDPTSDRGSGAIPRPIFIANSGATSPRTSMSGRRSSSAATAASSPTGWRAAISDLSDLPRRRRAPAAEEGFKITEIYDLEGLKGRVNSSPFLLSVANRPAHPNTAKVFINWLAGKEGLEIYSRGFQAVTLRTDVDESFLDPRSIPKPGVSYPDDADPKWRSVDKLEYGAKIRAMLKN